MSPQTERAPTAQVRLGVSCPLCRRAWNVEGELPPALLTYFCSPLRCGICAHPRMECSLPRSSNERTLLSPKEFYHLHTLPDQLPTQAQLEYLLLPARGEFLQLPNCAVLKKLHFPTHTLVLGVHTQGAVVVKCIPRTSSTQYSP